MVDEPFRYLDEGMQEALPDLLDSRMRQWTWALIRQYERVMDFDEPEEVRMNDLFLYPFCLRGILRIASLVEKLYQPDQVRRALLEFNQQVPNAVQIRDVIEHYDEYVLGTGRLQKKDMEAKEPGKLPWMLTITRGYIMPDKCILHLGGTLKLDIKEATLAAARLSAIVLDAIPESTVGH